MGWGGVVKKMAPAFLQEPKAKSSRAALRLITRLVQMHRHDLSEQAIAVSLVDVDGFQNVDICDVRIGL